MYPPLVESSPNVLKRLLEIFRGYLWILAPGMFFCQSQYFLYVFRRVVGLLLVVGCEVVALHRGFRVVDGFGFCLGNRL